ncbi:MAG: hypothetical protein V1646_04215 [bacterium]
MNNYSKVLGLFALVMVPFCNLGAMPGMDDAISIDLGDTVVTTSSDSKLDQQVSNDLAKLSGRVAISAYLVILNKILNYVSTTGVVTVQTQLNFCNAVKNFDKYARRFVSKGRTPSISKAGIKEIDKFLKNLQDSPLLHSGTVSYISRAIAFWDNTAKNYGLTPYQKAVKRQRNLKSKRK